jgi:deoxyribonuclease-4
MVKLGFHVSISGTIDKAVDRALELDCDTFQIFTRNPRSWASRELKEGEAEAFREKRDGSGMDPVFGHMPYILNLASPDEGVYRRSITSLRVGLERCSTLGIPFLVTHIGSHLGEGSDLGVARVVGALDDALGADDSGVVVLLENGSGSTNKVGSSFEELNRILETVADPDRVALCFDTCHAFAAGYELRTRDGLEETLESFDAVIGLDRIKLIHLNDSVGGFGTAIDHHEHIGLGEISIEGFRNVMTSLLADLPMVMETPVDERRTNEENMSVARGLAAS